MNMTEQQWGALFVALGQVPVIDLAMNLNHRETCILHEMAIKGWEWQARGFLHFGDGDKADARDLAQRLGIDPATAQPKARQSAKAAEFDACADRIDQFLDDLAHAGE